MLAAYLPVKQMELRQNFPIGQAVDNLDEPEIERVQALFPKGYLESCRVTLSTRWPDELRTGLRSGIHQEVQFVCLSGLAPDVRISVQGRIDEQVRWILPDGLITLPLNGNAPQQLTWTVTPERAGAWSAVLWTYLTFSSGDGQEITVPVASIPIRGNSFTLLGMDHKAIRLVAWILGGLGILTLALVKVFRLIKSN